VSVPSGFSDSFARNRGYDRCRSGSSADTEAVDLNDGQAQAFGLETDTDRDREGISAMVGSLRSGDPDAPHVPLWWVTAYDPEDHERGIGTDVTLSSALAAAWILSHDDIADRFGSVALGMRDFDCVPRHVPDGWTFEIDDMPPEGHG